MSIYACIFCVLDKVYSLLRRFILYVEASANGMFGAGRDGLINPPDLGKQFPLAMAEIAVFDQAVYDLLMDLTVLYDMSKVHTCTCKIIIFLYFFKDAVKV